MSGKRFQGVSWDSMFLTIVKVLTTLTSIAITKILSVGLSLSEYGTYSQAMLIISVGTSVLLLGLADALNYFYNDKSSANSEKNRISYVNTVFTIEIIAGICFVVILFCIKNKIVSYFSNNALAILIGLISIKPMLENILYFYQLLFISSGKAKIIAIRNLVIAFVKLVAIYFTVALSHDIQIIFVVLLGLDFAQLVFFKIYFAKDGFWVVPFKVQRHNFAPIIKYGIPMGIFGVTNVLTRDIDKLVIGKMANTETLAVYTNCSKVLPFDLLSISFATVLIPFIMTYVSAKKKENAISLFRSYIKIGYYSVWVLGVAVLIVTDQAIEFLYSSEYIAGKYIFVLYVFDSMLRFASMHLILTASKQTKTLMVYSIISLLMNTVLNIVMFYTIGIIGPAVATLICAVIYMVLVLRKSIQVLDARWRDVFDYSDLVRFISILVVVGVAFNFANEVMIRSGFQRYIAMLITMGGFAGVNLFLNMKQLKAVLKEINQLKI